MDSVRIELNEAKNLLKFAEKGYLCDSLIKVEHDKNHLLREAIEVKDSQLKLSGDFITSQTVKIRRLRIGAICLGGLTVIIAILGLI